MSDLAKARSPSASVGPSCAAGIVNSAIKGSTVVVEAAGRSASCPFKRDIHNTGITSGTLMKLRPLTFCCGKDPAADYMANLIHNGSAPSDKFEKSSS
jgi:hypothetical protein